MVSRLAIVGQRPVPSGPARITAELADLEPEDVRARFALAPSAQLVKTTVGLCSTCLAHAPAAVYLAEGRAFSTRACAEHGLETSVLENDERYYFVSSKDRAGRIYDRSRIFDIPAYALPGDEGCCEGGACESTDQMANKTCTILVEVTNACNLSCTVCYSDARGDRVVPLELIEAHVDALAKKKGGLDSVQLTGGEALLHPRFFELVAFLHAHPLVKKIYLPTNGLELAKPGVAARLAPFRSKLMVLLQLDGTSDDTDRTLRQATPRKVKDRVIAALSELEIFMQLTMTLTRGVNEDEVGGVIDLGLRHDHVKVIALQPATYSGRYHLPPDPGARLTLSDVVKAVVKQASARVREEDFVPIPCSHPNCGWITLFLRRFGVVHNVVRYVDLPKVIDAVSYKTQLSTAELRGAVGARDGFGLARALGSLAKRVIRSHDMFTVAIKPFMDRFTYDQDRVASCCHHLMDTQGVPTSFCEYNARLRPHDSWERFPTI